MTPLDRMPRADKVDPSVEAELDRLPATPIVELRKRYRELFRADVAGAGIVDLAVYCTGDWDRARVAEHASTVRLIRP